MNRRTIVYAADRSYRETLEAAIKSLIYNNHHIKIYVINTDIPQEWFNNINRYLRLVDSYIIDKKIDIHTFDNYSIPGAYLSYMAYGRLLIPDIINEDKVLYLDCDTIINGNINQLFDIDLNNHIIGAVRDCVIDGFNSGVMLINNRLLKKHPEIGKSLVNAGMDSQNPQADQSALNTVFGKNYLSLDDKYNYMVGSESDLFYQPEIAGDYFIRLANCTDPLIIHYTSANKPWLLTSSGRMRDLWWQYSNLEWNDLITNEKLPDIHSSSQGKLFIFTQGQDIQNIKQLAMTLSDFDFYIGAWTEMGEKLMELITISNIHLYPRISGPKLKELSRNQLVYLDIAYFKDQKANKLAEEYKKPILSFNSTKTESNYSNYHSFPDENITEMANLIRQYVKKEN